MVAPELPRAGAGIYQLYHGAHADHSMLEASSQGSFGSGIYLADLEAAKQYGEVIHRVTLTLTNPYFYKASFDHGVDIDSAAVSLVRDFLPEDQAEEAIRLAMYNLDGPYFDAALTSAIRDRGYDGLIVEYDEGSREYVAFNPSQVVVDGVDFLVDDVQLVVRI